MAAASLEIEIPRLLGSRESARELVSSILPPDVTGFTIILDFADAESVAQGCCDEIIKELLLRKATEVFVANNNLTNVVRYLSTAVTLRDEERSMMLIA